MLPEDIIISDATQKYIGSMATFAKFSPDKIMISSREQEFRRGSDLCALGEPPLYIFLIMYKMGGHKN